MALIQCPNCGALIEESNKYCPRCGVPLNEPTKRKRSKKAIWLILLAVLLIGGFFIKREFDSYRYSENLQNAVIEVMNSAVDAEKAGGLIHSVWYNSIFQIDDAETDKYTKRAAGDGPFFDDFNDALGVLFSDQSFQADLAALSESQSNVAQLMRELNNPPQKYQEDYSALKELYSAYVELVTLVINPSGTLESFTERFNDADQNVVECYYPLSFYFS